MLYLLACEIPRRSCIITWGHSFGRMVGSCLGGVAGCEILMGYRFNPPPNWPAPPPGWVPPSGWKPLPEWPAPPPGWQLWIDDAITNVQPADSTQPPPPGRLGPKHVKGEAPSGSAPIAVAAPPAIPAGAVAAAAKPADGATVTRREEKIGIFGAHKRAEALLQETTDLTAARDQLAAENERLRQQVTALLGMSIEDLAAETERIRAQVQAEAELARADLAAVNRQTTEARQLRERAMAEAETAEQELNAARAKVVATDEVAALQEVGIYEYRHPLQDAVAYKSRLADIKDQLKAMVTAKTAVTSATDWTVNGSAQKGTAMIREMSKLMLRAYNAEADNCVRTLRPHTLASAVTRLSKARDTIARLGKTMNIQISEPYHRKRLLELELTADYLVKQEEEKERIRAERERQKEEEAARRDFEREKTRLMKEQAHYSTALAQLHARGDTAGAAEIQQRLNQVAESIADVDRKAANIRAGYVYIISNIGSFGENLIKIGMTRRLDPRDRVRELGDASVPFKFDVHAFIFSEDAVTLETQLHHNLEHCRVNQVNRRREFFRTSPAAVLTLLERVAGSHLIEFTEVPEALEWRASAKVQQAAPTAASANRISMNVL